MSTTAHDMLAMLRAHYAGTPSKPLPGYFAAEIQAPNSARRADALWLPLAGTARGEIHGHEVKVSRQDVIVELADPMKAEAWGQFCDRWWLVVPDIALLRDLDIPDAWGILTPPSGRSKRLMTVVRPAPKRKPNRDRDAYATVLARIYYQGDDVESRTRWLEARLEQSEAARSRAQDQAQAAERKLLAAGIRDRPDQQVEDRVRRIVEAMANYYAARGDRFLDWSAIQALSTITDQEAIDILFDTAVARGRVADMDRAVASRLRWLEAMLDRKDLREIRKALQPEPEGTS